MIADSTPTDHDGQRLLTVFGYFQPADYWQGEDA